MESNDIILVSITALQDSIPCVGCRVSENIDALTHSSSKRQLCTLMSMKQRSMKQRGSKQTAEGTSAQHLPASTKMSLGGHLSAEMGPGARMMWGFPRLGSRSPCTYTQRPPQLAASQAGSWEGLGDNGQRRNTPGPSKVVPFGFL